MVGTALRARVLAPVRRRVFGLRRAGRVCRNHVSLCRVKPPNFPIALLHFLIESDNDNDDDIFFQSNPASSLPDSASAGLRRPRVAIRPQGAGGFASQPMHSSSALVC